MQFEWKQQRVLVGKFLKTFYGLTQHGSLLIRPCIDLLNYLLEQVFAELRYLATLIYR